MKSTIAKCLLVSIATAIWIGNSCDYARASEENEEEIYAAAIEERLSKNIDESTNPAEGYDIVKGLWKIGAIDYDYNNNPSRNMIVDLNDVDELSDLYDDVYLSFNADGTFLYINMFFYEGTYTPNPKKSDSFVLKTEKSYRLVVEDGEVKEKDGGANSGYYVEICDDSLHFQEYDPFTGKAKANDNGFYFVPIDEDSVFVHNNKADLQVNDSLDETDNQVGASTSSYADILDVYTEKMEKETPRLIREYENESAGVYDITELAEICNDKVEELAEICNDGIEKMADLMYENGDSFDTYSSWSEKLMNNYIEISQDIQDAYINSAM